MFPESKRESLKLEGDEETLFTGIHTEGQGPRGGENDRDRFCVSEGGKRDSDSSSSGCQECKGLTYYTRDVYESFPWVSHKGFLPVFLFFIHFWDSTGNCTQGHSTPEMYPLPSLLLFFYFQTGVSLSYPVWS